MTLRRDALRFINKSAVKCVYFGLLLLSCMGSLSYAEAQQEQEVLLFDIGLDEGWIPYQRSAQRGKDGVFKQVMDAVGRKSGISFKNVFFPAKRAEKALKDGLVDFDFNVIEWMPNRDYGDQHFVLSEPLFSVTEFIVTLDKNSHLYTKRQDYYGKRIGTISGYFYFDDDKFTRVNFLSEKLLMQGLRRGRFDAIILEKESARYWASIYSMQIGLSILHTQGFIRVRLRKQKNGLMVKINQGIQAITRSGELQTILLQHGIVDALPKLPGRNHIDPIKPVTPRYQ